MPGGAGIAHSNPESRFLGLRVRIPPGKAKARTIRTQKYGQSTTRSRYTDSLRAGWSGDRIPVGARFFAHVQTGPGAPPAPMQWVPSLFPVDKEAGAWRGVKH
jgi:hypothetical protein